MLVGYNTNVTYKGDVYHIQTEDKGFKKPVIVTLLFLKGTILSSKKISYEHYASRPDFKDKVREIMKGQHRDMIKELISGKHTPGAEPAAADRDEDSGREQPASGEESQAESRHPKSLDDILIDYIIKQDG